MFGMIPFNRNDNLFDYLDQVEKSFWDGSISNTMQFRCDVREKNDAFLLDAELPGFELQNIHLDLDGTTLTISAHREEDTEEKEDNGTYLRRERKVGSFSRSFDVTDIDTDNISAAYKNGVLELTLPKKVPQLPTARRIQIMGE